MWQSSYSRRKARQQAQKQNRGVRLHMQRVTAQLKYPADHGLGEKVATTILPARVILNDFTPRGLTLFVPASILVGETLSITLDEPQQFYIRGKVIWVQLVESRIVCGGETNFSYRMGIEFIFESEAEAEAAKAFCDMIKDEYTMPSAA